MIDEQNRLFTYLIKIIFAASFLVDHYRGVQRRTVFVVNMPKINPLRSKMEPCLKF